MKSSSGVTFLFSLVFIQFSVKFCVVDLYLLCSELYLFSCNGKEG